HYLDMVGVTGSNPVPPTTRIEWNRSRRGLRVAPFLFPVTGAGRGYVPDARILTEGIGGVAPTYGQQDLDPGLAHQHRVLQPPDLVADAGCVLELQVAGVLVHLLFQRLEPGGGLGRFERRVVLGLLRDLALPAAALLLQGGLGPRAFHDVDDVLAHRLRRDSVLGVVLDLLRPAPVGFVDRTLHRVGDPVGVQDRLAAQVAGGAA